MEPSVSIIIPCYNSGMYLLDAISSITDYKGDNTFEIIIVNDGSTDEKTLSLLNHVELTGCKVIQQHNQGPAAARNTGVKSSTSEYILFLDSDNKIRSNLFIDTGLDILHSQPEIGVFYGNAEFFGETNEKRFFSNIFDIKKMLIGNYIDMCSIIRKQVWKDVGGLDENKLLIGYEDWDFWLRVSRKGWKFYYCDQILFDYRVLKNSLVKQASNSDSFPKMWEYVLLKHVDILSYYYAEISYEYSILNEFYKQDKRAPFRTLIKNLLHNYGLMKYVKRLKLRKIPSFGF